MAGAHLDGLGEGRRGLGDPHGAHVAARRQLLLALVAAQLIRQHQALSAPGPHLAFEGEGRRLGGPESLLGLDLDRPPAGAEGRAAQRPRRALGEHRPYLAVRPDQAGGARPGELPGGDLAAAAREQHLRAFHLERPGLRVERRFAPAAHRKLRVVQLHPVLQLHPGDAAAGQKARRHPLGAELAQDERLLEVEGLDQGQRIAHPLDLDQAVVARVAHEVETGEDAPEPGKIGHRERHLLPFSVELDAPARGVPGIGLDVEELAAVFHLGHVAAARFDGEAADDVPARADGVERAAVLLEKEGQIVG